MSTIQAALERLESGGETAEADLLRFIGIPSISNEPGHEAALHEAAAFVVTRLRAAGIEQVDLKFIDGFVPPLVLASDDSAGPDAPLVLFYGHYDVQPAGKGWSTDESENATVAFDAKILHGKFVGRGAGDNKGPVLAIIRALDAWKQGTGKLPVRVRIIFEGEEENGSGAIIKYLASEEAQEFVKGVSSTVICDTLASPDGRPSITFGLRGLAYFELAVYGPKNESHSGHVGGAVQDPLEALCHMISMLRDPHQSKFQISGLTDEIIPLSPRATELLRTSPVSAASLQHETGGVPRLIEMEGHTLAEQTGALPSFTVHSLSGGNQTIGATPTNVPTTARAKFSIRLVPGMNPDRVAALVQEHLDEVVRHHLNGTVRFELEHRKGSEPVRFDPTSWQFDAMAQAMKEGWGNDPAFLLAGGSIPVVAHFERLGAPVLLWGGTNADSSFHGPFENLTVANYRSSALGLVHMLGLLAQAPVPAVA